MAEAFAELGNTNKALADLNELRENRMKPGTPPLAVDEDGIVATVRKERRRDWRLKDSAGLICADMAALLLRILTVQRRTREQGMSSN